MSNIEQRTFFQKISKDPEIGTTIQYNGKTHGGNDDLVMSHDQFEAYVRTT